MCFINKLALCYEVFTDTVFTDQSEKSNNINNKKVLTPFNICEYINT